MTDWMQGWGTVAGALFSALGFVAAVSLLWHEVRTRRRMIGRRQPDGPTTFDAHGRLHVTCPTGHIHVRNHSASPIIDVEVMAEHCQPAAGQAEQDILAFEAEFIDPGQPRQ